MSQPENQNPAIKESEIALDKLYNALKNKHSFIFEAGAGAGKTYSLIKALHYLIHENGHIFSKKHKQIACITYTNAAREEIENRIDKHHVVYTETIHAFCWSIIKSFQHEIKKLLPGIGKWEERINEYITYKQEEYSQQDENVKEESNATIEDALGKKEVIYQLGYPSIDEHQITLHHDDVLNITVKLLEKEKFRNIVYSKFPIILIDEYQDTFAPFAEALNTYFITPSSGPQIGFFGDHWQKIYGNGCGKIENEKLVYIPKNANFRSVAPIVAILNKMRPNLIQEVENPDSVGNTIVFNTNAWNGTRRTGGHWAGDLPPEHAHKYLTHVRSILEKDGWDFSPDRTKILMLTHNVLAEEQGYKQLANIFGNNDAYIKKENKYLAYFMDYLEPICEAYSSKKYGNMFSIIGSGKSGVFSHTDKEHWHKTMNRLLELREKGNIGEVIDFLLKNGKPNLPESLIKSEKYYSEYIETENEEVPHKIALLRTLRNISYKEVMAVTQFVNNHTPFATKHSVKGEEYDNVLVVIGRGWNQYNFDQMLSWFSDGVPTGKQETFERSRNLFYVVCSRPKKNLAILFTQLLSPQAINTLETWFHKDNIIALDATLPE